MQLERVYMGVSLNGGTPKSSILIGFSIINHPYWGTTILGKPHVVYPSDLSWPCAHPPEG